MTRTWWGSAKAPRPRNAQPASRRPGRARPHVERLEDRCLLDGGFRSITGFGNNLAHPEWGSAGVALLRKALAAYADGIDDPAGANRPSARLISNVIVAQTTEERVISDRFMSAMIYGWGQFLDHDLDLTPNDSPAVPFNISVPKGDPLFDPNNTGTQVIFLNRSDFDPATGKSTSNPRQQVNVVTAFIDGSMVYGSTEAVASALRTHSGGRLKTSPGADGKIGTQDDLLPFNSTAYFTQAELNALRMDNPTGLDPAKLFAAGDVRANENIELTSLHTLFVREHNRIADAIHRSAPFLSDEVIYQSARAIVGAEIQSITYNQWLPTLLGAAALRSYQGYNANVNPGIANEFSTALFRLGHSMLGEDVEFFDNNGEEVDEELALRDAFFNPAKVSESDIGPILKYLATDPSSEVDNSIVDEVRNFLFGQPGAGGFDLASLNVQRGRDHGLADYNSVRAAYGLPRVTRFDQITRDEAIQAKLRQLYGNVNNIDLWVGALAEDHVPGTSTGPLIRAALIDQFTRLRDGDRFWFERVFSDDAERAIENRTLADIIADNTPIDNLQDNVFFFRLSISGKVFNDLDRDGRLDSGEGGLSGRTIRLLAVEEGTTTLVATTSTDANGNYKFDVEDGLGPGTYRIREVLPSGWVRTTPNPDDIEFTRGDQFAVNINFGNARTFALQAEVSGTGGASSASKSLTQDRLQPIVSEALARWQAAGVDPRLLSALSNVEVVIADLPDDYLGWASQGVITIDQDAAGHGWFIDATPATDEEFPAAPGSPADDRMDLLSVVAHEMGHVLGFEHDDGDDVMGESLAPGVRHVPAQGTPVDGAAILPALLDPASSTLEAPPSTRQGQQLPLPAQPPIPNVGEEAAPPRTADASRPSAQTPPAIDLTGMDFGLQLLEEDPFEALIPG